MTVAQINAEKYKRYDPTRFWIRPLQKFFCMFTGHTYINEAIRLNAKFDDGSELEVRWLVCRECASFLLEKVEAN